jgi:hypothetical protein
MSGMVTRRRGVGLVLVMEAGLFMRCLDLTADSRISSINL